MRCYAGPEGSRYDIIGRPFGPSVKKGGAKHHPPTPISFIRGPEGAPIQGPTGPVLIRSTSGAFGPTGRREAKLPAYPEYRFKAGLWPAHILGRRPSIYEFGTRGQNKMAGKLGLSQKGLRMQAF